MTAVEIELETALERPERRRGGGFLLGVVLMCAAYAFGMLHDVASLRGLPRVKPPLMLTMMAFHFAALGQFLRGAARLPSLGPLRIVSVALAVATWLGFFYSVMVEVPLRKAWLERGHTDELVDTGFYALTRHPGVFWLSLALPFTALASRSRRMLLAAPLVALGDVVHVWFQEWLVLPKVFGDEYRTYQRSTPFVVPTPTSARRMLRTFRGRAGSEPPAAG